MKFLAWQLKSVHLSKVSEGVRFLLRDVLGLEAASLDGFSTQFFPVWFVGFRGHVVKVDMFGVFICLSRSVVPRSSLQQKLVRPPPRRLIRRLSMEAYLASVILAVWASQGIWYFS